MADEEATLDCEFDVRVIRVMPWGLEVVTAGGLIGSVDLTKLPSMRTSGSLPEIDTVLHVVVLDDQRTPFRASALDVDIQIARGRRPS